MITNVKVDKDQNLYIIETEDGFSYYGFENCENLTVRLAQELASIGLLPKNYKPELYGTIERYNQYHDLSEIVRMENKKNGFQSKVNLTPELIGLENKRVEVIDCDNEKRRFYVGKSTGWIPCHLEIERRNSSGGGSVYGAPFKSLKVIGVR